MPNVSASSAMSDPARQPTTIPSRSGLARKGLPIFIATLISRPLGFIREAVQAALFGASRLTDVFVVAYNVPEMIQTLFFSGVLSNFFVPIITRYREQRDELSRVFSVALNGALVLALVLAGTCYVTAPGIMALAAPGLSDSDRDLAIFLFRLMLPMLVLHCVLAVLKGVLNSVDHYAMPEYSGIFFNLAVIVSALGLAPYYGIESLAWGVVVGSIIQVLVQIPALQSNGLHYHPGYGFTHPAMREVQGLVLGAIVATAVVPINAFIARSMASSLPEGSISALAYAFRVFMLPVSLFAVPVYTVLLTDLSTAQHQGAQQRFKDQATAGLSLLFAVALPATAILVALAVPIVRVLYERGQFTQEDVTLTSQALIAYGTGTLAYGTSQVMVRLFNAQKDTRTPAWVGVGSIALSAAGNWIFMQQWGHWGIALVTSLVSYVNTFVLYAFFRHRHGPLNELALGRRFLLHFFLAAILGVLLYVMAQPLTTTSDSLTSPVRLLQFAVILTAGIGVYLVLGYGCKVEEIRMLTRKVSNRFHRSAQR